MNPFDVKAALLAKHAQHVVLVHFPIALFLVGTFFDVVGSFSRVASRKAALTLGARLNTIAAAVFVLPTLATGLLAWHWQLAGAKLKGILLLHLILGCTCGILILLVAWIRARPANRTKLSIPITLLFLELLASAVLVAVGHLGGFLSGVNTPQ